ncbi:DegT/DnrJ/EryC1/StrS family aminotransferase [Streptomyces collinus]|uniref:DegT/DnrJ/EryC1/StrS family aminotransferase n=1 Tax=Streptomyces collinus TaxID=42684 RepID=UPI0029426503|nr:DegT/DnrJ/EryC1/StrS family aminotransferase [Streptomyces collinus]
MGVNFCQPSGARHVLGVGNATQARHLVLPATGPAVGDRGRLPATTFAATASAVLSCGLIPSADVDDRFLVDTDLLSGDAERVIVVHLDGRVVGISNVRCVIQDCAKAMGAVHPDSAMVGRHQGVHRSLPLHHSKSFTSGQCGLVHVRETADWKTWRRSAPPLERNHAPLRARTA